MMVQPTFTNCLNCGTADHNDYECPCECHAKLTVTYFGKLPGDETIARYASDTEAYAAAFYFLTLGQYESARCKNEKGEHCFELRRRGVRILDPNRMLWHVEAIGEEEEFQTLEANMAEAVADGFAREVAIEDPPIPRRPVRSVASVAEFLDDLMGEREFQEEPPYGWPVPSRFGTEG